MEADFQRNFEELFDHSSGVQTARTPMPHEDFEPYFTQYAAYDSMLGESLSSMQDLDIAGFPSSPPLGAASAADLSRGATIKPSTVAKYSQMMNMDKIAVTPATIHDHVPMQQQYTLMHSSPPPSTAGMSSVSSSPVKNPNADVYLQPPLPTTDVMGRKLQPRDMSMSPSVAYTQTTPLLSESESEAFSSSETVYSPSHSPQFPGTQQFPHPHALHTGPVSASPSAKPPVSVFNAMDMGPVASDGSFAWQPVLTIPRNDESQQIIRAQQATSKQPSRKSMLPPGKVDSYLAGPDSNGMFECLFPGCGKLFRRRYNVRSHIQTHLSDRPYACDVCGACFVRPHDRRRHEKCHEEVRPYTCPCGKSFTRQDALHRHRIRMICSGGIEVPGMPKRTPGKRGRPRKKPLEASTASESDAPSQSPYSSSEHETDAALDEQQQAWM